MVDQQLVFAGGNNITLSQFVVAQSATITVSMGNTGLADTFSAGISNLGNTSGISGLVTKQLVLAGGNNITLSQGTSALSPGVATVTISAGGLSVYDNVGAAPIVQDFPGAGTFYLAKLNPWGEVFPGNMNANTVYLDMNIGGGTAAMTSGDVGTIRLGIYVVSGSSLTLINSVSTGFLMSFFNASNSNSWSGTRFFTIHSSKWSVSPTFSQADYYLGYIWHTSLSNITLNWHGVSYLTADNRRGTWGVAEANNQTTDGWIPFVGQSGASLANTAALPTSILLGDLYKAVGAHFFSPHLVFMNVSSNF